VHPQDAHHRLRQSFGWLAAGMSSDEIIGEYPELTFDDSRAALAFAANREPDVA